MKLSLPNANMPNRRLVLLALVSAAAVIVVCLSIFLIIRFAPVQKLTGINAPPTPTVVLAESSPVPSETPTDTSTPTVEPPTPSPSPTPTPSFTPTPSRTPTPTRTPTNTPTPDPWVSIGQWQATCNTEVTFNPVSASRFKFQVLAGGGDDKTISFYCCGSGGAAWLVNDTWVPVTNPSLTLKVGDTRETADFGSASVDRQRFNVGCNDGEQIDVRISYLPAPTLTITATATVTSTSALTTTLPLTATSTLTPTTAITATVTPTSTLAPTATLTLTPTATITPTTTTPITSTAPLSPTTALTPTVAAKPPAPQGSIAFRRNDNGIDRAFVLNLDNNTVTPLVDIGPVMDLAMSTSAPFGAWSPDNSKFAYISTVSPGASNILRVLDFKTNTTLALFSSDTGGGLSSPTWSPDGTKIAFIRLTGNQRLWAIDVVNADATSCSSQYFCEITTNASGEQFRGGLTWTKAGLFAFAQNTTGANDVYTMFSDGTGRLNITSNAADDSTPAWSPDGKLIAFTSNRGGRPQIYVLNTDGGAVRRVSQGDASDFSPAWSPDGNWIAFVSVRDGSTDLYVMDVNGGNVTRLTKTGGDHPIWSH